LHIVDGGDSSFDPGDYILFYAEINDGWLDSTLYLDPTSLGSPGLSLYNDTIQYFFTWNNSTTNLRYLVETDTDFASYTPSNYILSDVKNNFLNAYYEGEKLSNVSSSFFVPGEGWGGTHVNGATYPVPAGYVTNLNLYTQVPYTGPGAPLAHFHSLVNSNSNANASGSLNHHLRWGLGISDLTLIDTTYSGYTQIICDADVPSSELINGYSALKFEIINDLGAITDYQAFTYYSLRYPRIPDFLSTLSHSFAVDNNLSESKIRLDITSLAGSFPLAFVNGDTPRIVPIAPNGGVNSMLIPNSSSGLEQNVVYIDSTLIIDITAITPVGKFNDGAFTDFANIINPDGALLMIYNKALKPVSDLYNIYRQSTAGGSYNTVYADVDELYQQFGGGIEKHINGVRRFAHFMYNTTTVKPSGLFLMGKAIREANHSSTTSDGPGTRWDPARFSQSLIPSFGEPSSDAAITAGLEGTQNWVPLMPTGRISARTNLELEQYFNKVVEYEDQQDQNGFYTRANKDWQKQIIHFAGGSDTGQQAQFKVYVDNMKTTIEDSLFGGNVMSIYKTSSDPLDPTILGSVTDRISAGTSLLTYFGHFTSTSSGFEINLDDPVNWNNKGKYPVMLVNSCYNGNIFQLSNSNSEEFVQVPNAGAIAYIASVHIGFAGQLGQYSNALYTQFSKYNYGGTLGEQMRQNISYLESTSTSLYVESTALQMVLNGDPMLRLNWHELPEIELTQAGVFFTPEELDLTVDSIEMHIVLTNLGKSITLPFALEVIRDFPLSTADSIYNFVIDKLNYKDTFSFKMPMQANIGLGLNNFTISVDLPTQIPEIYDEVSNNQIVKTLFLAVDGILPVIPYNFAVVPIDSVTVKASTINPVADYNTYRFELDTTDLYNSLAHRYAIVSGYGGVKEVHPSEWIRAGTANDTLELICEDSVVYFWRVALEDPVPDWHEYSFQHIIGKEGWGQDHFFQFKNNGFNGIIYDRPATNTRIFGANSRELLCDAMSATADAGDNAYYINGNQIASGLGTYTDLHVAVIDPVTLEPWRTRFIANGTNMDHDFGNNNNDNMWGLNHDWLYFTFNQLDSGQRASFRNMVLTEVPDSFYILIYAPVAGRFDTWDAGLDSADMYNAFLTLGSDSIYSGRENRPFIYFGRKGNLSTVVEDYPSFTGGDAHITANLSGYDYIGVETSPLIGPAADWHNVYWKQDPSEVSSADTTRLIISAYDINKTFQFSIDTLFTSDDSLLVLSNLIDAVQYPFINLQAYYKDSVTFTPAQIDRWHVLYETVPEAAIDGSTLYTWTQPSDTLEEGQSFDFAVDVKNIYTKDMDSLLITYWVEDAAQNKHLIAYARQDSLLVGEVLRDTITVNTVGLDGINSLWMEVNPYLNGSLYITDQPEQEHFNNLLQLPFYVNSDDKNPILDVTFNGRHILNGDIVDPSSELLITLKDDNIYLIMDDISDTTLFGVYLTDPFGVQVRIPFVDGMGNTVMQWIPADSQSKRFKIIWPSEFAVDGTYTLFVQGADRSGNISGDIEYRVSFEVIHESSITNMMNYPNPFSTSTRFVFTMTGSEEPDEIIIQIMTVSGR
jgi:hypothetical protein